MDKSITIGDIADELGISKTTVSRAISGKGRIGENTRKKVLDYIEEHDYRPNVIARSLAQQKTFNIGVVLPSDTNMIATPFFQACLMGVCEIAATEDYDVIVTTTSENDISYLKRMVFNNKADGYILTRSLIHDAAAEFLKAQDIPYVLIGTNEDKDTLQIDNDHAAACCELTSILLKSGNRKVSLLAGNQGHVVNRSRYEGFCKAFENTGKQVDEELVYLNMSNQTIIDQTVEKLMENPVDCIICSDDVICSRVLAKLHRDHYRIPENVKVASFYNNDMLETYDPPITAIRIDVKQLGIAAGDKLLKKIAGHPVTQSTLVNYEIIIKNSTM